MPHTPGPWLNFGFTVSEASTYRVIANCNHSDVFCADYNDPALIREDQANACLVAAAPTLLAALQLIVAGCDLDNHIPDDHLNAARRAIARAFFPSR